MSEAQRIRLLNALTTYDRKQAGKRGYNPYALGHYCEAVRNAAADMSEGYTLREALIRCFNGRLLDICLKAVGEAPHTDLERRNQSLYR